MDEFFGEIIHSYTRADAIRDGVLIDVTDTAREAGFKIPVALTTAVYEDCVRWDEAADAAQDESGRLWDVLWMAMNAARRGSGGDRVTFTMLRVKPGTDRAGQVTLKMIIGPGDTADPVITIMEPGED